MSPPTPSPQAQAADHYTAVKTKIERDRLQPWSSAPALRIGETIVRPLTLRSHTDLTLAGNALVSNPDAHPILPGDIAAYIWRHHPDYAPAGDIAPVINHLGGLKNTAPLLTDIAAHQEAAFAESPAGVEFGGTQRTNTLPPIPPIASLCHEYGSTYSIDPRTVADIDLRIVFQCCRAIRMAKSDIKYSEPKELRAAKSQYLQTQHG